MIGYLQNLIQFDKPMENSCTGLDINRYIESHNKKSVGHVLGEFSGVGGG